MRAHADETTVNGIRRSVAGVLAHACVAIAAAAGLTACADPPTAASSPSELLPTLASALAPALEPNATVVRVVDGDTIVVDVDGRRETVRLIGIDTPETVKPEAPVECFGPESSARTHDLLPEGTPVRLERDAEARDDYGRLLAYVHRASDALFVNLALIREGLAAPMIFPTNTAHADAIVDAARAAERADIGLWAACGG